MKRLSKAHQQLVARAAMMKALSPINPKPGDAALVPILMGTPSLGLVRLEWAAAWQAMVSPPNWSVVRSTPIGYNVPDAQNMLVDTMLRGGHRALMLIEDDTCPPPQTLLVFDRWLWKMERKQAPPVVSGVYHIKGSAELRRGKKGGIELLGPEPLIYKDPGQRAFRDFKYGDVAWCAGVPTGALMVHRSVFEAWAAEPDLETQTQPGYPFPFKKIFQQPSHVWVDPHGGTVRASAGTTDLWWSEQTIKRGILAKAGWGAYYAQRRVRRLTANGRWPYIVDTGLRFDHIDRASGARF